MQDTDVERRGMQRVAASLSPKLLSLTCFGFIAAIYVPAGWPEVAAIVIAIVCAIAAIAGYVARWNERRAANGDDAAAL